MSHYFIEDPTLPDHERELIITLSNKRFSFITNSGLFSNTAIDYASELLITTIPPLSGSILDVGCGYGLLGIVLGKIYSLDVTMSDVNPTAIKYTKINAGRNKVPASVILSNCFDTIEMNYDSIVTNPPIHAGKDIIYKIYEKAHSHLHSDGSLFVVIQKKHGADSHIKKLKEIYSECLILYKRKGYYILQGKK